MSIKNHYDDESELLINNKAKAYNNVRYSEQHFSRLELAESSWTRYLNILLWYWIKPILSLGYTRPLTDDDFDSLPQNDKSLILLNKVNLVDLTVTTTWKFIVQVFWKEYVSIGVFLFPYLIARIAQPLLIRQICLNISKQEDSPIVAYCYAILLFIAGVVQVILQLPATFYSNRIGIRIRNSLTLLIYKHSLSLEITSFKQINTAQIINLVANDTAKLEDLCRYLHFMWAGCLEAIIIFGLLCWIIGFLPILFSYAIFILFIITQLLFSRKFHHYRKTTAKFSDERIHAFREFIYSCSIIKMYNWEKPIEERINQIRQRELTSIRYTSRLRAFNQTQFFVSTPLLALITFGTMWFLGYPLHSIDIFTTLSFFTLMRLSVTFLIPLVIERISEAHFALERIDTFIRSTTIHASQSLSFVSPLNYEQKGRIVMSNATLSWKDKNPCLLSLNITIEPATFVGISGPVGSGKSSLFAAILGELNLINGQLNTYNSSVAYTSQSSWIFADTLRNNILFGKIFNEERYQNVIYACCLDVDFNLFGSSRDLIMIGENGVNVSGGQKTRISLARALYIDADIYLLDDPFAAVDHTVAKQIYERCIGPNGLLKQKTRLLITHQTEFLAEADQTIFLHNGYIDKKDHFNDNIIRNDTRTSKDNTSLFTMLDINNPPTDDMQPIIIKEISVKNTVNWSLWWRLFTSSSIRLFGLCLLIILLLIGEFLYDASNYWLRLWLKLSYREQQQSSLHICIYSSLIFAVLLTDILRSNYFFSLMLHGSNKFHNNMLKGLLTTTIQFFENNPSGRILNRVSKDQQVIDELLPTILYGGVQLMLMVIGSIIMICLVNPYVLLSFIILIPICWLLTHFYLPTNREIKRLESISRSPIYTLFTSSLNGLITIRAFKAKEHLIQLLIERIDANTRANITMLGATQWFHLRLNLLSCIFMLITTIFVIILRKQIPLAAIALSLMYTMSIIGWFSWSIRQFVEAQILMTSAERIDEYAQLPSEEDPNSQKRLIKTSTEWPDRGTIEFRNYSLSYRSDIEPVLKNLTVRIESGEKIGIIGRTGAGKSSLFKGLFRFIDRSHIVGEILIDDVNISQISLDYLRSHLSVIPQQPIIFSGTLRYNIDPFNQYTDEECLMALEDVQLKQLVSNDSAGLLMPIMESGSNISVGQSQLICIARAILKKTKILLIDEATANLDQNTDELIQTIIADKFQNRTVLTIAHRLNTIARSDRILVLDKGIIVDFDIPANILQQYQR